MQTLSLNQNQKHWPLIITRLLGLLIILQAARAVLSFALWRGFGLPDRLRADTPALIGIDLAAFAMMVGLLFVLARPSPSDLALDLRDVPRAGLIFTRLAGLLFALLLGISFVIFPDQILNNLRAALVVPVVEELIFRGILWSGIRKSTGWPEWIIYGVVTLIFALWHLGYTDSVLRTAGPALDISRILLMKVIIGAVVGALAGLARWRVKNIYAAIIIHGLWNLFGR